MGKFSTNCEAQQLSPYFQESTLLMADTYSIQHETINKENSVKTIIEEWPFLFEAVYLFKHTSTILGFPVQTNLVEEFSRKERSVQNFLDSKGMKIGDDPVQMISGIARHFKENPDHLFYQNEVNYMLYVLQVNSR